MYYRNFLKISTTSGPSWKMETLSVKTWSGRGGCTLCWISSSLERLSPPGESHRSRPCHRPCLYQDHLLIGLIVGTQSTTVLPCYLTSALWWWSSSTRSTSQTLDLTPSDWAQQTSVLTKASLVHFQTENCSNGSEFSHLLFSSPKPSSILNVYFSALECQDSLAETSSSMQTASKITLTRKFSVLQPTPFWCCSKHFLLSWNLSSLFPYSGYLLSAGSTLENMPVRKKLLNALQLTTLGESSWHS